MTIDDVITALENENAKLMNRIFDLEAENERRGKILNSYALQYGTVTDQSKKVKEIKSEAYKEFAEEYEKRCIKSGVYPAVTKNILKNLVKELTEGSDEEVKCIECEHLMFSDMYGECSKGHRGIVRPDDSCMFGKRKVKGDD